MAKVRQVSKYEGWSLIPESNCKSQMYWMCTYIPNIEALGIHATEPIANGELQVNEEALLQNDLSDMQLKESPP